MGHGKKPLTYYGVRKTGREIRKETVKKEKALFNKMPGLSEKLEKGLEETKEIMKYDPEVRKLKRFIRKYFDTAKSHPLHDTRHAFTTAVRAGTIAYAESRELLGKEARRKVMKESIIAGLLHDTKRVKDESHQVKGSVHAKRILRVLGIESDYVLKAIELHEKRKWEPSGNLEEDIVVASVYDADKYSWGIISTTHDGWRYCEELGMPVEEALKKAPREFREMRKTHGTMRTQVGKTFIKKSLKLGDKAGFKLLSEVKKQQKQNK